MIDIQQTYGDQYQTQPQSRHWSQGVGGPSNSIILCQYGHIRAYGEDKLLADFRGPHAAKNWLIMLGNVVQDHSGVFRVAFHPERFLHVARIMGARSRAPVVA